MLEVTGLIRIDPDRAPRAENDRVEAERRDAEPRERARIVFSVGLVGPELRKLLRELGSHDRGFQHAEALESPISQRQFDDGCGARIVGPRHRSERDLILQRCQVEVHRDRRDRRGDPLARERDRAFLDLRECRRRDRASRRREQTGDHDGRRHSANRLKASSSER